MWSTTKIRSQNAATLRMDRSRNMSSFRTRNTPTNCILEPSLAQVPPLCRRSRQGLALLLGAERLGELAEIAVEHLVEAVDRELDPMVGHAVLREVVGPDLLRPLARPDLRPARRRKLGLLFLPFELVEPRAEDTHRLDSILELRLLVLHGDHEARREVRDANGGVGRVHALAAGAGRAHHVDAQVVLVDLDLDL